MLALTHKNEIKEANKEILTGQSISIVVIFPSDLEKENFSEHFEANVLPRLAKLRGGEDVAQKKIKQTLEGLRTDIYQAEEYVTNEFFKEEEEMYAFLVAKKIIPHSDPIKYKTVNIDGILYNIAENQYSARKEYSKARAKAFPTSEV